MGATMVYQGRSPAPEPQVSAVTTAPTRAVPETSRLPGSKSTAFAHPGTTSLNDDMVEKSSIQTATPAQAPAQAKKVIRPTLQPVPMSSPGNATVAPVHVPTPASVAAILGVIGGGFAGDAIEKNLKKETVYQVGVYMEGDLRRTVEATHAPIGGGKVIVEGSSIGNNALNRSLVPVAQRVNQPVSTF